ncbi:hypothetical protein Bca52824_076226 [Brassica carinata]|uniref:Uncharacterized protein n=1 Tax=Brassica carinata TaxID=52824 RepID=A0A8X7PUE0_BRACI|nr:hypothetical protein Bca52824_076226 [Brassica carinata]
MRETRKQKKRHGDDLHHSDRHAFLRLNLPFIDSGRNRKRSPDLSFARARYPQSLHRNHLFTLLLQHVGGLSQTIEISPDTTKLPTTREIIVLPALSTRGRDQSKHEIISAFEPLKTLGSAENHLIVDLTDFTSAESFIIKTRTPPP